MNGWYYGSQGQQSGPVSEMELRRLLATGVLTQQALVWRDGMEEWKPVAAVPELLAPPVQAMQSLAYQQANYGIVPQSGAAIASMVCGIVGVLLCYVHALAAIPAVICGHIALKNIRESQWLMAGRGMAIAGLIMGYLGLLLQIAMLFVIFAFFYGVKKTISTPVVTPTVAPLSSPP